MFSIVSNYNIVAPDPEQVEAQVPASRVYELPGYFESISRHELTHISPHCTC